MSSTTIHEMKALPPGDPASELQAELALARAALRAWSGLFLDRCLEIGDGQAEEVPAGVRWQYRFHRLRVAALERALEEVRAAREREHATVC